ncbi:hypothetical protein PS681_05395 [Pseudomonas fluorescens]|nr:hypothetical protein PS681_05395 [Pseudomonas fluorescens]
MLERRHQGLTRDTGFTMSQRPGGFGHHEHHDDDAHQRHAAGGEKQSREPESAGQQRPDHHGHGERQTDGHTDHGHRFGAMLFAGQVGKQRHDCCGDRPGTLQDPAGNHAPDRIGLRRQHTAEGKDDQPEVNHRTAANAVRNDAERNLKNCLGQAVRANSQPDQGRGRARQIHAIGRQHRQHHEHAKHTEGEHQGQTARRAGLAATHAFAVGIVHGKTSCEPAAILPVPSEDGVDRDALTRIDETLFIQGKKPFV